MEDDVVIVAGTRTALTNFGGPFKDIPVPRLAALAVGEAIRRAGIEPDLVDRISFGYVIQSSEGPNVARQAGLYAGLRPETFTGNTLNFQCGSGLEAVNECVRLLKLGECDVAVAGGVEIMSRGPYLIYDHRWGHRMGEDVMYDYFGHSAKMVSTDLWGIFDIAQTAENLAQQYSISRSQSDEFAAWSNRKAIEAQESGRFDQEIFAVEIPGRKGSVRVTKDERPRADATIEKLSQLRPAFRADGTVTAGNASGVNDGAAALLLTTRKRAQQLSLRPLAAIRSWATAGVDPRVMGIGPVPATKKALAKAGLSLSDLALLEINEAFAAQALAVVKELEIPMDKLNVNGGAVALGHPVGCSGARILVTLIYELMRKGGRFGLASLCCGGGLGVATIVENESAS
ncbi:MAG: acetyl-CoA C-acetyltransferase [Chloroflexota bacterium]|nr:MAG: acetyl-CoA C-acetyltransferase [Chloroflexota bacterium]